MTESDDHLRLKDKVVDWLQAEHGFALDEIEKEYQIEAGDSYYLIDVVGVNEEKKVAVECGSLSGQGEYREKRLEAIKEWCDEFKRFSYIYANADDLRQKEISRRTYLDVPDEVREVLTEHGLRARKAARYVQLSLAHNLSDIAEIMDIGEATAHRYRRGFQAMDRNTRREVIRELVREQGDAQ